MTLESLDNPVWASLQTRHASLAVRLGGVSRYPTEIAPFVAIDPNAPGSLNDLAELVATGETVCFVGPALALHSDWIVDGPVPIAQMVCHSAIARVEGPDIVELSAAQVPEMLALTALVYPHYFRARTIEMGRYLGIYSGDMLVAMAGERMGMDRHQEISAVCTHPDFTGRGYAQRLVAELSNAILDSGRLPFLHVSHANTRAKSLYQRMGYMHRADVALLTARPRAVRPHRSPSAG